ncbi:MAG: TIGR04086 family membrane protein [Clostridia bacterium]|nr:TIGR04086 family membrane protein [Clostridia bacterium]
MNKWALMVGIGSGLATTIFGLLVCIWRVLSVWAPEMDVGNYLQGLVLFSAIIGGMTTGWLREKDGWKYGGWSGFLYFSFLLLGLEILAPSFFTWSDFVVPLLLCTALSAMAGALGLNLRHLSRKRRGQKRSAAAAKG